MTQQSTYVQTKVDPTRPYPRVVDPIHVQTLCIAVKLKFFTVPHSLLPFIACSHRLDLLT